MIIKVNPEKIYEIREQRVMLDYDLAELYQTDTKTLLQAVKKNQSRFPPYTMFQLMTIEWIILKKELGLPEPTSKKSKSLKADSDVSKNNAPYAFTDLGLAMLSSVLNSEKAVAMNMEIIKSFLSIRRIIL